MINVAKAKENDFGYIKDELSRIVRISKGRILKAVIETCYLTREEIKNVCKACIKAKVDYSNNLGVQNVIEDSGWTL